MWQVVPCLKSSFLLHLDLKAQIVALELLQLRHIFSQTISSRLTQIQRGLSLPCKSTCRRETRICRLRKATSTSWSTSPTLTGGLWGTAMGMAHLNFHPIALINDLTDGYLLLIWQEHWLCTQHICGRKKWRQFWKISVSFYLIDPAVAKNISDNGLRPLIESFVVCHRWYSKHMDRMHAQELLMREVKSQKNPLLKMFDCFLISPPCF